MTAGKQFSCINHVCVLITSGYMCLQPCQQQEVAAQATLPALPTASPYHLTCQTNTMHNPMSLCSRTAATRGNSHSGPAAGLGPGVRGLGRDTPGLDSFDTGGPVGPQTSLAPGLTDMGTMLHTFC